MEVLRALSVEAGRAGAAGRTGGWAGLTMTVWVEDAVELAEGAFDGGGGAESAMAGSAACRGSGPAGLASAAGTGVGMAEGGMTGCTALIGGDRIGAVAATAGVGGAAVEAGRTAGSTFASGPEDGATSGTLAIDVGAAEASPLRIGFHPLVLRPAPPSLKTDLAADLCAASAPGTALTTGSRLAAERDGALPPSGAGAGREGTAEELEPVTGAETARKETVEVVFLTTGAEG